MKTIQSDTSNNYAINALLSQNNMPVNYGIKTLSPNKCNSFTIENELLAVVWAIKYFRLYLYCKKFTIYINPKPTSLVTIPLKKKFNLQLNCRMNLESSFK